jgi:tyrosyl-tRNA synthetase
MTHSVEDALHILTSGTAKVLSEKELKEKLELGRPLRIKFGVDPTAPDIHLGHTVPLEKLRQFQELGHHAILLIGDFTATVGDPTGRSTARPPLTREEVLKNAETYTEQAFKVLDRSKTEIIFNGNWFRKMNYEQILKLNAQVTLQQMLQREDFKERIAESKEIRLHELQYPIMQGWDSVELQSDVEIGGTDQLFNMLVGRDLQKEEGQLQQSIICMPLVEGLDGVKKMSKSAHNYVGVNEEPNEMFGKLMSISDDLMDRYYTLLLGQQRDSSLHPMEAKKQLATQITSRYHSEQDGIDARTTWEARFSKRDTAAGAKPFTPYKDGSNLAQQVQYAFLQAFDIQKSLGEIRKQYILPGAVQLNGKKLSDPAAVIEFNQKDTLRLSKKHSVIIS